MDAKFKEKVLSVKNLTENENNSLAKHVNFWSRFHNNLPPEVTLVQRQGSQDVTGDGLENLETEEQFQEIDILPKKKESSASIDEGFEDCMCPDEEDDIFTKSLAVENLNLQNFLIVPADRKKKISDISEIMAYNRIIPKTECKVVHILFIYNFKL